MMIRQPFPSRVMLTERRRPSASVALDLELVLEDPWLLDRTFTELWAEPLELLRAELCDEAPPELAVAAPPVSATQLSSTLPSAL
jgi:hypothetical protein